MTSDVEDVRESLLDSHCNLFRFNDESFSALGVHAGDRAVIRYGPVKCGSLAAVLTSDCGPILRIVYFQRGAVRLRALNPLFRDLWYGPSDISIIGAVENVYSQNKPLRSALSQPQPLISWAADERGKVTEVSEILGLASGQDCRKFLQDKWVEFVHPEEQEYALATWHRSLETGEDMDLRCHFRSLLGGYMQIHSTASPLLSDTGKVVQWTGSVKIAAPTLEGLSTRFIYPEKAVS